MKNGYKRWYIPDAFYHSKSNGIFSSHEAVCILNIGNKDATIELVLYFADRDKLGGFFVTVPKERNIHVRMDSLISKTGQKVPTDTPYAIVVNSDEEIIVQYSRMDTSQAEMALMTTMAFKCD